MISTFAVDLGSIKGQNCGLSFDLELTDFYNWTGKYGTQHKHNK